MAALRFLSHFVVRGCSCILHFLVVEDTNDLRGSDYFHNAPTRAIDTTCFVASKQTHVHDSETASSRKEKSSDNASNLELGLITE